MDLVNFPPAISVNVICKRLQYQESSGEPLLSEFLICQQFINYRLSSLTFGYSSGVEFSWTLNHSSHLHDKLYRRCRANNELYSLPECIWGSEMIRSFCRIVWDQERLASLGLSGHVSSHPSTLRPAFQTICHQESVPLLSEQEVSIKGFNNILHFN